MSSEWKLSMLAEPVVPAWTSEHDCNTNGAELQRAILRGFADMKKDVIRTDSHEGFTFEKTFTFKEHGEFFRGALTMASLRYTGDFFELLQRYGTIKVTITKFAQEGVRQSPVTPAAPVTEGDDNDNPRCYCPDCGADLGRFYSNRIRMERINE